MNIYIVNIYKTINNQYAFSTSTDQYHKLQIKPFIEHQL